MLLSIVIPVFNEDKDCIEELRLRIDKVCAVRAYDYEIIFIDDASVNGILDFLKDLRFNDKRIKLISFGKNYGQMNALLAGVYFAKGDVIITMDADLQYLPEEIPRFMEKIELGFEAVAGRRKKVEIGFLSKMLTGFLNVFLKVKLSDHGCSYNALKKELVNRLFGFGFVFSFKAFAAMSAKRGVEVDVTYNRRKYGKSRYSFLGYLCYGFKYLYSFLNLCYLRKNALPQFKITLELMD